MSARVTSTHMSSSNFLSRALVGRSDASTSALQGLRTLACVSTLVTHVELFSSLMLDNVRPIHEADANASWLLVFIYNVLLSRMIASVDIFFFVSGFFFADSISRAAANTASHLAQQQQQTVTPRLAARHLFNRSLRFAPVLLGVSVMGRIACNPACIGWLEIFSLNRFPPSYGKDFMEQPLCNALSWSLQNDIQAHAVMLFLLVVLPTWSTFCKTIVAIVFIQPILRASHWVAIGMPRFGFVSFAFLEEVPVLKTVADVHGFKLGNYTESPNLFTERRKEIAAYRPVYFNFEFRYSSILIGTLTWYAMKENVRIVRWLRKNPNAAFTLVVLIWAFCMHGTHILDATTDPRFAPLLIAYEGLGHTLVAVATGIVAVLTVTVGDDPSGQAAPDSLIPCLLRRILAHPVLVSLSRTTFAVYLVHLFAMPAAFYFRPKLTAQSYSLANFFLSTLQLYACSLLLAAPLAVLEQIVDPFRKRFVCFVFDKRDFRADQQRAATDALEKKSK